MNKKELGARRRRFMLALGIAIAIVLFPAIVSAQSAPDDLIINSVQGYQNVLEDDDLLVVVFYDIEYASPPTQLVSDTFIGRFLRDTTDLNSTELFPFNQRGYNQGIFSFYWTAAQRSTDSVEYNNTNSENYLIRLQGKVGVFPGGVPSVTTSSISWRTTVQLGTDIIDLALALDGDADWVTGNQDLITTGDLTQFTASGEEYFATVIPRLASMVSTLFESAVTVILPVTRTPQNTYSEELQAFWVGTFVDTNLQRIADNFRITLVVLKTFMGFLFMITAGFIATMAMRHTGNRAAEFGMLTMALVFVLEVPVGIVTMPLAMITGLLAIAGLAWAFFGRRGG